MQALASKTLSSFMLQDLRRFVMYDSSATMPYLVSAMSNWARAERLGYMTLNSKGKVTEFETVIDLGLQLLIPDGSQN